MKNYRKLFFAAALMLGAVACDEPVEPIEPAIEVNPSAIVFDSEGGTKSVTLNVNDAWSAEVTKGAEWLTLENASGEAGEAVEVKVKASAHEEEANRSGEIVFTNATATAKLIVNQAGKSQGTVNPNPDAYIPEALYIIGDPTDFGWNRAAEGSWMTKGENGIFTWEGNLHVVASGTGGFKFLEFADEWDYGFCRDGAAADYWTIIYRTPDNGVADTQFHVDQDGWYEVTLDAAKLTLKVERKGDMVIIEKEPYIPEQLFLVGDGTDFGWDANGSNEAAWMTKGENGNFTWEGHLLHTGKFKFLEFVGDWEKGYNRDANASEYWTLVRREGGADEQFQVAASGIYRVSINVLDLTISAELLSEDAKTNEWGISSLYVIGDAISAGWDTSLAPAMEANGNIFTWTGELDATKEGFKFLCQNNGNWVPSLNRDASAAEYWTLAYRASFDDPDEKFQVEESGTYTLTVNLDNFTISAVKQ